LQVNSQDDGQTCFALLGKCLKLPARKWAWLESTAYLDCTQNSVELRPLYQEVDPPRQALTRPKQEMCRPTKRQREAAQGVPAQSF